MKFSFSSFSLRASLHDGTTWAIADQATVSLGNFATNLLLAKMLSPSEYGTFVLINAGCFLASALHNSVILSPMVVFSASSGDLDTRRCGGGALLLTPLAVVPFAAMVLGVSLVLHRPLAGLLTMGFMLAWQLQETTRRSLLSRFRYRNAIWGDGFSYIGQALLVGTLCWVHALTLERALAFMAGTSALAAVGQAIQGRLMRVGRRDLHELAERFWSFGKWLIVASLVGAMAGQLPLWILAAYYSREQAAAFQALVNVLGVTHPILLSISAVVLPAAATALQAESASVTVARDLGSHYIWQFEVLLAPLLIACAIWPSSILRAFYGASSPYVHLTTALRIMVAAYLLTVPALVFSAILTGHADPRSSAMVQIGSGIVAVLAMVPGSLLFGVIGATAGDTLCRAARVAISYLLLGRRATMVVHRDTVALSKTGHILQQA